MIDVEDDVALAGAAVGGIALVNPFRPEKRGLQDIGQIVPWLFWVQYGPHWEDSELLIVK